MKKSLSKSNFSPSTLKKFYIALAFLIFCWIFLTNIQYTSWIKNNPDIYNCFLIITGIDALIIFILGIKSLRKYLKYWRKSRQLTKFQLLNIVVIFLVVIAELAIVVMFVFIAMAISNWQNSSSF